MFGRGNQNIFSRATNTNTSSTANNIFNRTGNTSNNLFANNNNTNNNYNNNSNNGSSNPFLANNNNNNNNNPYGNNNNSYGNNNNNTYGNNNNSYGKNQNNQGYGYGSNRTAEGKFGSYRVTDYMQTKFPRNLIEINPKWKSEEINPLSIAARQQSIHLSTIELRLEDYYLIRKKKLNREEEKLVRNAIEQKALNVQLIDQGLDRLREPVTFREDGKSLEDIKKVNINRKIIGSQSMYGNSSYGSSPYGNTTGSSAHHIFGVKNNSYNNNYNNNNNTSSNNASNNIFNRNNSTSGNIFGGGNNNNTATNRGNPFTGNNNNNNNNNNAMGNSIFGGNNNNNNNNATNNIFNRNNNNNNNGGNNIFNTNNNGNNSGSNSIFNRNNANNNNTSNNMFNNGNNNNNGNNIFSNTNNNNNGNNNIFGNNNNSGSRNIFNTSNNNNNNGNNIFSGNNNNGYNNNGYNNNGYNNNNNNNNNGIWNDQNNMLMMMQLLLENTQLKKELNNKKGNLNNGYLSSFQASNNPYFESVANILQNPSNFNNKGEFQFNNYSNNMYRYTEQLVQQEYVQLEDGDVVNLVEEDKLPYPMQIVNNRKPASIYETYIKPIIQNEERVMYQGMNNNNNNQYSYVNSNSYYGISEGNQQNFQSTTSVMINPNDPQARSMAGRATFVNNNNNNRNNNQHYYQQQEGMYTNTQHFQNTNNTNGIGYRQRQTAYNNRSSHNHNNNQNRNVFTNNMSNFNSNMMTSNRQYQHNEVQNMPSPINSYISPPPSSTKNNQPRFLTYICSFQNRQQPDTPPIKERFELPIQLNMNIHQIKHPQIIQNLINQNQPQVMQDQHLFSIMVNHIDYQLLVIQSTIVLTKINLPTGYFFTPKQFKGFTVENLQIGNQFATVKWTNTVNVKGIDFSQNFEIAKNKVICSIPQLDQQCTVTFNSIPPEIMHFSQSQAKQLLNEFFLKNTRGLIKMLSFSMNPPEYKIRITKFPQEEVF